MIFREVRYPFKLSETKDGTVLCTPIENNL